MKQIDLLPPLPEPLSHDKIRFIFDRNGAQKNQGSLSNRILVAIGTSVQASLPPAGDIFVDSNGAMRIVSDADSERSSADSHSGGRKISTWYQAALLEGIDRSNR